MTPTDKVDPMRWWALGACLATVFMTLIDFSIVAVALPSIATSTGAHPSQLQWVISGYALGFGIVAIIGGRLGDDRGRKLMLLIATAGFVITSAVAGLAPSVDVLLGARVAQGLFGGLVNPQVSGLVQNLFPGRERARAFSFLGALIGIGTAAGPVLGGLIIFLGGTQIGWRLTFLINVPIGIAAYVLCARWLPDTPRREPPRRLDLPGAALLTGALLLILFPAVEYDSNRDLRLALLLIPAAGAVWAFLYWETGPARRRGYPLIDTGLFRIKSYADGCLLGLIYFGALATLPLILTLYLQQGLGYSAIEAAAVGSGPAIMIGVSALVAGRLLPRYRGKVLVASLSLLVFGNALLIVVTGLVEASSPLVIGLLLSLPLVVVGLGQGGVSTPNQVLTYTNIDAEHGSTAGGMLQTAQRIGIAIGSAIGSAVYYTISLHGHPVTGRAHQLRYGHAFNAAMVFALLLSAGSLVIAIRSVRHVRQASLRA